MILSFSLSLVQLLPVLLFYFSYSVEGTVTQSPAFACTGDSVIVSCSLTVPNAGAGDLFDSRRTDFILGEFNNSISESDVDGSTVVNGIELSRFIADAPLGTFTTVTGSVTLLSYNSSTDNGFRMGCRNDYTPGGGSTAVVFFQTITLEQAALLFPIKIQRFLANFNSSTCTATLSWIPDQTIDGSVERYFLFENDIFVTSFTTSLSSFSYNITLQLDTYYYFFIIASNCAGNATLNDTVPLFIAGAPDAPTTDILVKNDNISPIDSTSTFQSHLQYKILLIQSNHTTQNQIVGTVQDYSQNFNVTFSLDTCYYTKTTVKTCALESSPVLSREYIIYSLNISDEYKFAYYQSLPSPFIFEFNGSDILSYNLSCSNETYDSPFLDVGLLLFQLRSPNRLLNITEIVVKSPFIYMFNITEEYRICHEHTVLRMYFNNMLLSDNDITICRPLAAGGLSSTTIILISIFISLLSFLVIVIILIIIFLLIRKNKFSEKKG